MTVPFKRGDVFLVHFSEVVYDSTNRDHRLGRPLPHTVLKGMHLAIVLSDDDVHDGAVLSEDHVVVVPISSSRAAVASDNLLATHVPLEPANNPFLTDKSYALVHQPITVPRHWLREEKRRGVVFAGDMEFVSLILLLSTGCSEHVQNMIDEAVTEAIKDYAAKGLSVDERASSDE